MTKRIFVGAFLLSALVLTSCAPTSMYVRTNPSSEATLELAGSLAIVGDSCIIRDAVGNDDYFSILDSELSESFMLASATEYIKGKGYPIAEKIAPFACGFKAQGVKFRVAERRDAEVTESNPPFRVSESIRGDEEYQKALLAVIRELQPIHERWQKNPKETTLKVQGAEESLKVMANRLGSETALFLIGNGTVVPVGKSMAQAIGTGILTLGMVSVWQVSYLDTWVSLVDLRNGELLWSNSMRLKVDPTAQSIYPETWSKSLLYHIPTRKAVVSSK